MKLQEEHLEAIENNIPIDGSLYSDAEKAAEVSAQITKDYMKRFKEWSDNNYVETIEGYTPHSNVLGENPSNKLTIKTIYELIEIFLETEI